MVIQLARAPKRERDASAALRHLWGIVIVGSAGEQPLPNHYIAGRVRRLRPELSPAARERALVRLDVARHAAGLAEFGEVRVVVQPSWRGTAAQIFLPALRILREDPHATIVVLPHEQMLDQDARIVHYIEQAARAVEIRPDVPVVI